VIANDVPAHPPRLSHSPSQTPGQNYGASRRERPIRRVHRRASPGCRACGRTLSFTVGKPLFRESAQQSGTGAIGLCVVASKASLNALARLAAARPHDQRASAGLLVRRQTLPWPHSCHARRRPAPGARTARFGERKRIGISEVRSPVGRQTPAGVSVGIQCTVGPSDIRSPNIHASDCRVERNLRLNQVEEAANSGCAFDLGPLTGLKRLHFRVAGRLLDSC
jgi:hypothetical protein